VPDVYTPVPSDLQRLAGVLSVRIRANSEGYLEKVGMKPLGTWPDNGVGLLLAAAANAYEYSDDPQMKAVMDRAAKFLVHAQQSGDLPLQFSGDAIRGLLAYSRVTGNEEALATSRRIGDSIFKRAGSERQNAEEEGAGQFLGALVDLYRATGDNRYLDFCNRIARLHKPAVTGENDYKEQYELLQYLSGLADLYRITGESSYLQAVGSGWENIRDNSLGITGAPVAKPKGGRAGDEPVTDACLTAAWTQLSFDLLQIRGSGQYAQELEHSIFNQLLAFQDQRTGGIDPRAAASGSKNPSFDLDRCSGAAALAISEIPEAVWGRYGNGIAILSYQPGRATIRLRRRATVQIYSEGDYPESGSLVLHVEPSHDVRFPLRLRVPIWATKFDVTVGDTHLSGVPGEYLVLGREWKPSDTVKISIELAAKEKTDIHHPDEVAIQRGPELLALSAAGSSDSAELKGAGPIANALSLKPVEGDSGRRYTIPGQYEGKPRTLTLVPFSEALADYRLWLKAPAANPQSSQAFIPER
jgi:uncharacterized protein